MNLADPEVLPLVFTLSLVAGAKAETSLKSNDPTSANPVNFIVSDVFPQKRGSF
jgi:hypothetical protein